MTVAARVVAFYLPQFHPTPENDAWWGKGFTEWTTVAKARRLFPGHDQPRVPRDLGFYDLRVAETREAQAEMARAHGVEAFCYWHYWFAGRRILERPFEEVLASGVPDFPFCLAWANQSWYGAKDRLLIEQTYPGTDDHAAHFEYLLRTFRDPRYLRVEGKPLFAILCPKDLPEARQVTDRWRDLARRVGLEGLYLVALGNGEIPYDVGALGFDAFSNSNQTRIHGYVHSEPVLRDPLVARYLARAQLNKALRRPPNVYSYRDAMRFFLCPGEDYGAAFHPTIVPNWDHSPRSGRAAVILHESTPELFREHVRAVLASVKDVPVERRLVFVKSWNEWAEGNYLEPDLRHGDAYLKVLADELR